MSTFNTPNANTGLLIDIQTQQSIRQSHLNAEKSILENNLASTRTSRMTEEEVKSRQLSHGLRYIMLSYVISTRAFYAVTKKMLPNITDEEMQKAIESSQNELLDKYGVIGGDKLSEKFKEYGVVLSNYFGPRADKTVLDYIKSQLDKLSVDQIDTLNSLLAPIVMQALKDPEYDVGLPREEKPKSKMGM